MELEKFWYLPLPSSLEKYARERERRTHWEKFQSLLYFPCLILPRYIVVIDLVTFGQENFGILRHQFVTLFTLFSRVFKKISQFVPILRLQEIPERKGGEQKERVRKEEDRERERR